MEEEKNLKEKVDEIYNAMNSTSKNGRVKRIKIPRRAKVRRGRLKKGYVGILRIDENGNISGEKKKVEGSVFQTKDKTFHATDGTEILFWEGKYPVLVQETKKINPVKFNHGSNETHGQKYIMAKMLEAAIKVKNKMGGIIWIVLAIVAVIGISMLLKKGGAA